ncbi:MAG: baseplate J/gp47 family protein [Methylococcales bacterium]|nr:baseplate J/gp47 family protein [Methylococcales bacterium]MDD5630871.1 baseplate J/gp47 family protein [Methylococcales bacterium]
MTLNDDFGQAGYLSDLRVYLIAQSKTPPGGTNPNNPPYIPTITSLSADYATATQNISLNESISKEIIFERRQAKFYHLYPFGHAEQHPWLKNKDNAFDPKIYLVPQFYYEPTSQGKAYDAEFYIGVTGLKPPQNLALLFQVADGTADPLSIKPNIHWSYLRNNEWIGFAKHEVQDGTDGLINSGIITFSIPDEASSANTMLPTGQHWLRAAVADESDGVCRLLAVSAQGLTVTFQNQGNDPAFPEKVLTKSTISKLNSPDAAIKAISQPFPSFGGRGAEQETVFYTRVSERLRHKDRAIALWDYEHLILEAFPQIYKAKCLNHTRYETDGTGIRIYNELAPGHVTIVTIPDIPDQQFHNLRDPLKPFTSLGLLAEIKEFLTKRLSCFVQLHVENPRFEEVRVNFKVKFYEGFDEIFYEKKLNQAITAFLSPWAFASDKRPSFGGKIYKSVLMNFIEEQPYVDYVTDFQLFHDLEDNPGIINKEEVEGSTAISILVSSKNI